MGKLGNGRREARSQSVFRFESVEKVDFSEETAEFAEDNLIKKH